MPLYQFRCEAHGEHEVYQGMNDRHEAVCPQCGEAMRRIYTPSFVKCGNAVMGTTRMELFDNLARDGFASKDWRHSDNYYKQAMGITD